MHKSTINKSLQPLLYIGLMSGTSMDGISTALVDFSSRKPLLLASQSTPYADGISAALHHMVKPEWRGSLSELLDIDVEVGRSFAKISKMLLEESGTSPESVSAIGHHGQTIWHQPDSKTPSTLQIGDPNIIAELTGINVVADFRRRDMAAGGQGAPLAPAFHLYCFSRSPGDAQDKAVLNLGGIANLTILSSQLGYDTGPANTLLDAWISSCLNKSYDNNGDWGRSGVIDESLLEEFLRDPYFLRMPPKSTGRETFNLGWVQQKTGGDNYSDTTVQATLTELTASTICTSLATVAPNVNEVIVCGGGVKNSFLLERLKKNAGQLTFVSSSKYGVDADYMEAMAFAWLAKQTMEGKTGNIPSVTGARGKRVLGCIYPAQ